MRIAVPDLISNSYFPAVAAIELGYFKAEGLDAELEMISPIPKAMSALRDGEVDFVAGPAPATLAAFPDWKGAKLVAALAKQTFWLLVVRADLEVEPGDVQGIKGLRIGAAPGPELAFRHLLSEAGIDPMRNWVRSPVLTVRTSRSVFMPRAYWRGARSTDSGRTLWAVKWRFAAGRVRLSLMSGGVSAQPQPPAIPSRRW